MRMIRVPTRRLGLIMAVAATVTAIGTPVSFVAAAQADAIQIGEDGSRLVAALQADLESILRVAAGNGRSSRWSVLAVSLDRGDTLFAASHSDALAPASNMKLLTAAAAIEHLGPDFRYQTFLLASGPVHAGRLEGDLVLYGTGDPGLSDRFSPNGLSVFRAFADSLSALGITIVEGDVVGDGSYFEGPLLGDGWNPNDLNDWFAAPSSAISFNENVFSLRVRAGSESTPEITTLPAGAGVPFVNSARVGTGPSLSIRRTHPSLPILVQGALARGRPEVWRQMTVQDPAHFAASVLRTVLEESGIQVIGGTRVAHAPQESALTRRRVWAPALASERPPRILARHTSPPLTEYLDVVNKRSHNLLADQVYKTMGRVMLGDGSFRGGARALERFLSGSVRRETLQLAIYDGSGLSSLNRMSASDFVAVMDHMAAGDRWDPFWGTLPEAGNPRELRRMARTAAAGNLRAKTGTIQSVSALSGMVRSADGERIAFSIISNQVASTSGAKGIEDRIGSRLAAFTRPLGASGDVLASSARLDDAAGPAESEAPAESRTEAEERGPGEVAKDSVTVPTEVALHEHRVQQGESFTAIARRYGVPVDALQEANPGVLPGRLQVGTLVKVPVKTEPGG